VASHGWDLAGALRAGFRTVLVTRGRPQSLVVGEPVVVVDDMSGLAKPVRR
jgi:phosphoglycolate phosphatase-like HAD superfamily hydrolase